MTGKQQREMVHVLVVEHKYGDDIYVCRTRQIAHRELDKYVRAWWPNEMEGQAMPKDPARRVEEYFSEMGDRGEEFYTIRETKVLEKWPPRNRGPRCSERKAGY